MTCHIFVQMDQEHHKILQEANPSMGQDDSFASGPGKKGFIHYTVWSRWDTGIYLTDARAWVCTANFQLHTGTPFKLKGFWTYKNTNPTPTQFIILHHGPSPSTHNTAQIHTKGVALQLPPQLLQFHSLWLAMGTTAPSMGPTKLNLIDIDPTTTTTTTTTTIHETSEMFHAMTSLVASCNSDNSTNSYCRYNGKKLLANKSSQKFRKRNNKSSSSDIATPCKLAALSKIPSSQQWPFLLGGDLMEATRSKSILHMDDGPEMPEDFKVWLGMLLCELKQILSEDHSDILTWYQEESN
eukprot:jgi/Psemu1/19987/gm1.19987_g